MSGAPLLTARGLRKRFAAVRALDDVSLDVAEGEIHALVGENGAGKSTLGKVVSGDLRPDEGRLAVGGRPVHFASPRDALAEGVTAISQEIALAGRQTVLENVFLGREPTRAGVLDRAAMRAAYGRLLATTGFDLDPDRRVERLRLADQKKVEVLQAIARDARLVVMDEPTAMLADDETRIFLDVVRRLRATGCTIVYVSHFLEEVLALADTVTVMRNGRVVRTSPTEGETPTSLVEAMLGKPVEEMYPTKTPPPDGAPVAFSVEGLRTEVFRDVSLRLREGEIVGLAGLVGSGRSRLAHTLFGAERILAGTVRVRGEPVRLRSTADAIRAGIHLVPESRKEQGLLLKQTVRHNVSAPHLSGLTWPGGVIRDRLEVEGVRATITALDVRPPAPDLPVRNLSGGNQQKVLFGKWLFRPPKVLIVDEPTRGVDVGAKQAIYELIVARARTGTPVLVVSSEIEEILGLAHRVLVMRQGAIVAEVTGEGGAIDAAPIMNAAFGTEPAPAPPHPGGG